MTRKLGTVLVATFVVLGTVTSTRVLAGERGLLWRVVQTCIANHDLTGASFPCLAVQTSAGATSGFAVLRSPLDKAHVIVTPTIRTIGIESARLRTEGAPDYFADAWASRHYVSEALGRSLSRGDFALAVNSKPGRSQDQLHIHVDCVHPALRDALARREQALHAKSWTKIDVLNGAPRYWAILVEGDGLADLNPFAFVAAGLHIDADDMDDWTIVIVGAEAVGGKPGFFLLARKLIPNGRDIAHGEALLDHDCHSFR